MALSPRFTARPLAAALVAATALGMASAAQAQSYPSRSVKIVVPFAAGGPADIYARFVGQRLTEAYSQPFVIENRPGGGSVIGTDAAAKSPADGYTLLMMSNTHTINESLIPNKPYALMKEFTAVAPVNTSDLVLVVHPSVKATTLGELIAAAKAAPRSMNYASSGPGTPYHLAGEMFNTLAGIQVVHVPYKGSSGARTDVLGGQVQMMFDAVPTMVQNVRAGKVRAIATTGKKRSDVMPDVPTMNEAGVPGYDAPIWLGFMAPTGTPRPVVDKLNGDIARVVTRPDVKKAWFDQGADPMVMSPAEFDKFLHEDIAKWTRVVRASGAKVD